MASNPSSTQDEDVYTCHLNSPDPAQAEGEELRPAPDRAQIRALLMRYFQEPITDVVIDRIDASFRRVYASRTRQLGHARGFEKGEESGRWEGKAWYESLATERPMGPTVLLLMIADVLAEQDPSFPKPRPFCPQICVGTWQQILPRSPSGERWLWELAGDGTFRCDAPEVPSTLTHWCVNRDPGIGFALVFHDGRGSGRWSIDEVQLRASVLTGELTGVGKSAASQLRLQRVPR